jgi:hypothetical protein
MAATTQLIYKPDPSKLATAKLKPLVDELLAADNDAKTSGAPFPKANKVTP